LVKNPKNTPNKLLKDKLSKSLGPPTLAFLTLPPLSILTEHKDFLILAVLILFIIVIMRVFPGFKRIKAWLPWVGVEVERESQEKTSGNIGIKDVDSIKTQGSVIGQQNIGTSGDIYQGHTTIIYETSPELEKRVVKLEETIRQLPPSTSVSQEETDTCINTLRMQLAARNYEHLDDAMRELIHEGHVNMLKKVLIVLGEHVVDESETHAKEREANAEKFAKRVTEIGKYACRKKDIKSWENSIRWLIGLRQYFNDRQFRQAEDIFNNSVGELYSYGLEHFLEEK